MSNYSMILTKVGLAKVTNAQLTNENVLITHFVVGDGNGTNYVPTQEMVALKNEKWRGAVSSVEIDKDNPHWIIVTGAIPAKDGGFMIREAGLIDKDGDLVAIGNTPETYKPLQTEGAAKDLILKQYIEVSNAASVTLQLDPTVIIASRDYVDKKVEKLDAEFEQVTEQLAQNEDIFKRKSAPTAVFGFLFDDIPLQDYTNVLPVTSDYNIPISVGVITDGHASRLFSAANISKLHELEDVHRWDLLAHTDTHPRLADLTYEQQEKEMVDCINKMVSAGFKRPRGIVYPYGSFNSDTITLARKHFEFGTRAGTNKTNSCPIDTYRIQRIQFDFTNPNNAFWWYKQQIDRAYKNGEAIIFMGHSGVVTEGRNWFDEAQALLMREVIEYVQSIGMPIKTVSDIYDMYKNVYDSPIYEESIGANGKRLGETSYGANTYTDDTNIKATTLIGDFVDGVTRKTFLVADGETFIESNGGTLITYKHSLPDLSWQKWHPAGRRTEYKRTPVNNGASWSNWRKLGVSDDVGYTDNNFVLTQNLTSLLNDFPYGRSVRFLTGLTDFKDGTSGTLITRRYENGLLSWQEFHPSGTANVYKRTASADGSVWRKWRTVGDVQLTDSSTDDTPPSSYTIGRTVELLTSNYVLSQSFPAEGGGALLITETSIEPHILTTQRFVDKDGYEYTRLGLNDTWTAWRTNKVSD